jgi:hypothetical protein
MNKFLYSSLIGKNKFLVILDSVTYLIKENLYFLSIMVTSRDKTTVVI